MLIWKLVVVLVPVIVLGACSDGAAAPVAVRRQEIVGGQPVPEGRYPRMAAIFHDGDFRCGGALTEAAWVLTAAHCVRDSFDNRDERALSVGVGSMDLAGPGGSSGCGFSSNTVARLDLSALLLTWICVRLARLRQAWTKS